MYWIAGLAILLLAGLAFWWWWKRRESPTRLISFVALLREPKTIAAADLARIAGAVWHADLGDGQSEGKDGFVVGVDVISTIKCRDRLFLVNSFPKPYVDNTQEAAEQIPELRLRQLFAAHQAWFSCDALGVDRNTSEQEVHSILQMLGKLFAELLDDQCLLIYLPDAGEAFPITDQTKVALRMKDPVAALRDNTLAPMVEIDPDDPEMIKAVAEARAAWPRFVAAFEARAGQHFSVKAPVTYKDNTEFIWIEVESLEGDYLYGVLANEPGDLGPLKEGSKVRVPVAELNDWCYLTDKEDIVGGFTVQVAFKKGKPSK